MINTWNRSLINTEPTRTMIQEDLKEALTRHLGVGPDGKFVTSPEKLMLETDHKKVFDWMSHHVDVMDPDEFCEELSWKNWTVASVLLEAIDRFLSR